MAESVQNDTWKRWHDEYQLSCKARGYQTWQTRARKIVKRYRDERGVDGNDAEATSMDGGAVTGARFNILWSNVQTLLPALIAKPPKPVVERRYLDRDDVGRTASVILERALLYEIDNGSFQPNVRRAVLDRLLPGRGVVWLRYEPKFSPMPEKTQGDPEQKQETPAEEEAESSGEEKSEPPEVMEEVASECTPVDYVDWQDFKTSVSRTWEEVWWIDKMVYMTRDEMKKRKFKGWDKVPLDWSPEKPQQGSGGTTAPATGTTDEEKRAKIHETWSKKDRKVYWWADGWSDQMLDEMDDPLQLEGFWPTPKPLFSTLTNDSLVPVPDYHEYQDQAIELDDLTTRIANLTKTIKACGVYDASVPELQRMFEEGFENKLVPADNMAEFMAKAGANGMGHMWLLPVKDMVFTLHELYKARAEVKQSLYEITGISDIVRGAAQEGGAKTATEQRIKGQFASMRLNEMQADVARFARDVLRIMGEIIAEHYDPMTLYLVSGFEQYAKEQWKPEPIQAPPLQPGMMPPDPAALQKMSEQAARQKAAEMFKAAIELLRNDKLRGFRIDIETDSLIEPDQQATQQARTELLGAIAQFLPQAIAAGAQMPELKPLLARLLMFFLRGFKASRDIESAFEQFVDDMTKEAANPKPKPPSPEQIKAQAEMQKQQMENQRMQQQAQIDQQQAQQDIALEQAKAKMEIEKEQMKLQFERERLQMEREKMAMQLQGEQQKAAIQAEATEREVAFKMAQTERQAQIDAEGMDRQAMADQQKHELGLEVMAAKAEQAKKPKAEGRAQ